VEFQFAGLGGDTKYYKVIGESAWFVPLPVFNLVWAVRGLAGFAQGYGGEEVPIFERFFLGGANTLRGQRTRTVAPKDDRGEVIGGTSELLFNTELLIPIIARFRLALFFDAGNAYGFGTDFDPTNLRYSAGVGVRFFSPLGPMRLDLGYNLDKEPGEKDYQVNFTVGAPF
jgi:outer membrane protein insertion porin family